MSMQELGVMIALRGYILRCLEIDLNEQLFRMDKIKLYKRIKMAFCTAVS